MRLVSEGVACTCLLPPPKVGEMGGVGGLGKGL